MSSKVNEKNNKTVNKNRIVLIAVAIFLAAVLLFGAVIGTVYGVRYARSRITLGSVTADEGEVRFLSSYYKYEFMRALIRSGVSAYDTEEFWASESESGRPYGDLLREGCESYIKDVIVKNYVFDKYGKLTSADKETIDTAVSEILDYKAENSEEKFNELCSGFGFDFSDFCSVAQKLYKAQMLKTAIFGADGSELVSYGAECREFFENYSHVKLLFIRTEDKFLLDDEGNRVRDENNNDTLISLTDGEKAERAKTIADIRAAIESYRTNGDSIQMSPSLFDSYLSRVDEGDPFMRNTGYYFYEESAYTREFASAYPDIVKRAQEMSIGDYSEISYDGGVCFIYKYENTAGAYTDTDIGSPFADFYLLLADKLCAQWVEEFSKDVKVKDSFLDFDLALLPYNNEFTVRF